MATRMPSGLRVGPDARPLLYPSEHTRHHPGSRLTHPAMTRSEYRSEIGQALVNALLQINGLGLRYRKRQVVEDVALHLAAGQSAAILGRSGSGKSSILAALLGMVKPVAGTITVDGIDATRLRGAARRNYLRSTVSVVFQRGELLDELEPLENVMVPALLAGIDRDTALSRSRDLLERVSVPATGITTGVLSGGEQQRVAVARALVTRPKLVLADEPTGSLDVEFRDVVGDLVLSIPEQWGAALLMVTHDETLALRADATYRLTPSEDGPAHLEPGA